MQKILGTAKDILHKDRNEGESSLKMDGSTQSNNHDLQHERETFSELVGAVNAHNVARREYSVAPLQWSPDLASQAESWAKELVGKGNLQHSGVGGENLHWSSKNASFTDAVNGWLDEENAYAGEKIGEGDFGKWGHFCTCST